MKKKIYELFSNYGDVFSCRNINGFAIFKCDEGSKTLKKEYLDDKSEAKKGEYYYICADCEKLLGERVEIAGKSYIISELTKKSFSGEVMYYVALLNEVCEVV